MYKDDNMTKNSCNNDLLRMIINRSGTFPSETRDLPKSNSCDGQNSYIGWGMTNHPLSMVYAPWQNFDNLYDLDKALNQGTVFAELDLPFSGRTISKGGNCRG